jgi:peroxiredoxin
MKTKNLLFIALLSLPFSLFAGVKTGEMAPNFTGMNDMGESVSLADLKGKYVVLEWLNHGCPFVKKHYKSGNMQAIQQDLTGEGVVWISVISSAKGKQGHASAEKSQKDRKKHGSNATHVLLDDGGAIGKMFGAKTTPHMFMIDPEGVVVYQGAIDSISSASAKDVAKAENYVMAAFNALSNGETPAVSTTRPYGCSVKY